MTDFKKVVIGGLARANSIERKLILSARMGFLDFTEEAEKNETKARRDLLRKLGLNAKHAHLLNAKNLQRAKIALELDFPEEERVLIKNILSRNANSLDLASDFVIKTLLSNFSDFEKAGLSSLRKNIKALEQSHNNKIDKKDNREKASKISASSETVVIDTRIGNECKPRSDDKDKQKKTSVEKQKNNSSADSNLRRGVSVRKYSSNSYNAMSSNNHDSKTSKSSMAEQAGSPESEEKHAIDRNGNLNNNEEAPP